MPTSSVTIQLAGPDSPPRAEVLELIRMATPPDYIPEQKHGEWRTLLEAVVSSEEWAPLLGRPSTPKVYGALCAACDAFIARLESEGRITPKRWALEAAWSRDPGLCTVHVKFLSGSNVEQVRLSVPVQDPEA
jgi:hypothetical protein